VAVVVGNAAVVSSATSTAAFDDDRTKVDAASMACTVLLAIPLGTVLLEELACRGTLLAFLPRLLPVRSAVIVGSVRLLARRSGHTVRQRQRHPQRRDRP